MFAVILLSVVLIYILVQLTSQNFFQSWKKAKYPPCPFRIPLIGNLYCIRIPIHKQLQGLSRKFGPLMTIWIGSKPMYVVNDIKSAHELLESHTVPLACRPKRYIGELYSNGFKGFIVADYGKEFKELRLLVHTAFRSFLNKRMGIECIISEECIQMGENLISESKNGPVDVSNIVWCSVANIITGLLFGRRYKTTDVELKELKIANDDILHVIMLSPLYDIIKPLRYLPFGKIKRFKNALKWRDNFITQEIHTHTKSSRTNETQDATDIMLRLIKEGQPEGKYCSVTEDQLKMALSDLYIAGADTTAASIQWAILYLTIHQDVQQRVHKELDVTLGDRQYPCLSDQQQLPYTLAMIYETMRLSSVAALGVPHLVKNDIYIDGYKIEKGSVVLFNLYSIHHDPHEWIDPYRFFPERFLSDDGTCNIENKSFIPFSLGIRACIGKKIAMTEMFLFLGYLLKNFHFDKASNDTVYDIEATNASTLKPKPFRVSLKQR